MSGGEARLWVVCCFESEVLHKRNEIPIKKQQRDFMLNTKGSYDYIYAFKNQVIQTISGRTIDSIEVIYPEAGVYQIHCLSSASHFVQVTFPLQPASQPANFLLLSHLSVCKKEELKRRI